MFNTFLPPPLPTENLAFYAESLVQPNRPVDNMHNVWCSRTGRSRQYNTRRALCMPRKIRNELQTRTQTAEHLSLYHGYNGYANAPQAYAIRTVPILLSVHFRNAFHRL